LPIVFSAPAVIGEGSVPSPCSKSVTSRLSREGDKSTRCSSCAGGDRHNAHQTTRITLDELDHRQPGCPASIPASSPALIPASSPASKAQHRAASSRRAQPGLSHRPSGGHGGKERRPGAVSIALRLRKPLFTIPGRHLLHRYQLKCLQTTRFG
jgi:hypothetical protein